MAFAPRRPTHRLMQRFDADDTVSKVLMSWLMLAATVLPLLVVYDAYTHGAVWGILALTIITSSAAIYVVRQISQNEPAPFFIILVLLCLCYHVIAVLSWGIDPVIYAFWPGVCAGIAAAGLFVVITIVWVPRHDAGESTTHLSAFELLGVVLLSIAALAVRFYAIDTLPVPSNLEATFGLDALATQTTQGVNPLAFGIDPTARLYAVLQGGVMQIFGNSLVGSRVLSAVIGSLTVTLLYLATRIFFDKRTAWLTAVALLTLNVHLEYSRVGLNVIADAGLLCVILAMVAYGWETGKRRYYLLAGIGLGLCQYTYQSAKVIPVVFAIWLLTVALQSWDNIESRKRHLTLMWIACAVVALPMYWNLLQHWERWYDAMVVVSMFGTSARHTTAWIEVISTQSAMPTWMMVLITIRDAAAAFVAVPLRDGYDVGSAMLSIPSAVLFIVGLLLMMREYKDPRYWLLFIGLSSAVAVTALSIDTPAAQRLVYITPFVAVVIGIGLAESGKWFRLEWLQSDWSIPLVVTQALSIVLAVGLAGYDGVRYMQLNQTRNDARNDQSAAQISQHIQAYPTGSVVYFFTQPVLSYEESALIALLAPQVSGIDVYPPLTSAPPWQLNAPMNSFVFTPERIAELALVRQHYPGGTESRLFKDNGETLLIMYDVTGVSPLSQP